MATVAGRAIIPFIGDYSGLIAGAEKATEGIATKFKGALGPVAVFGASVAAVGGTLLDLGANYQKSTDQIAASSGSTIAAAQRLGRAWLATGGQVDFTAQQMESAYATVAGVLERLNGGQLSVAESTGFMAAAMDLAEASAQPLDTVVSDLAAVMQAYGIAVDKAASTTDVLRNVSAGTGNPLDALTSTLERLHTKLGPLSPDLQDTSTLLLDLAANGVTGARGLLAVSSGMTTLLSSNKNAVSEVKELGVDLYTANGQFVGMQSVIEQLSPKLDKMTEKQRLAAESALFGSGSAKTLDATLMAGLPAWDSAAKAADKTGTAHDAAAKATSGLSGELDLLKTKVIDGATSFATSLLPDATAFTAWILNDGVPDLEKFGKWVDENVINPFVYVAKVVLPPVLSGLGFLSGHLEAVGVVAAPIIAGIAGMWAIDKIKGWSDAALSALQRVGAFYGFGSGPTSQLAGATAVQQVFVTNWEMIGGGSGAQYLADDAIGAGAGLGGGEEAAGLLASILTPEVMVPIAASLLATLGIAYVATHPAPAPVTKGPNDLASAVAKNPGLLLGENPQHFNEPNDSLTDPRFPSAKPGDRDRKAQELSDDQFRALQDKYTAIAQAQGYTLAQWVLIQQSATTTAGSSARWRRNPGGGR